MWFGIPALVITGMTWSFVGIVMGSAPKKGIKTSMVQFFSSLVTIFISIMLLLCSGELTKGTPEARLFVIACCLGSGILNFTLLELMSKAMQTGPNGIVWSIVQSGLIFPFSMGILCFNVPLNAFKMVGIVCLITALAIMGTAKDNTTKGSKTWLWFAFSSFLFCGIQQSVNSLPSYHEDARQVSPVLRTLMNALGVSTASLVMSLVRPWLYRHPKAQHDDQPRFWSLIRESATNKTMWIYIGTMQGFSLICSYCLMYPGMDALAEASLGNVSYPLLVSSCIVGFFLYSCFILKEKSSALQYVGVMLCLLGIVLICVQSTTPRTDSQESIQASATPQASQTTEH